MEDPKMINMQQKDPIIGSDSDYRRSYLTDSLLLLKNRKQEQWTRYKETYNDWLSKTLHMLGNIDGISLWKINRKLNRFADRGIPKEDLINGKIIISLPKKQSMEMTSTHQKSYIEKAVDELEGFENLRLSQFYIYKPTYIEKKSFTEITRWIEIEIFQL